MRIKLFFMTLFIMLFMSSLSFIEVNAQDCDYVDEDGYCVIIVDNEDEIPSIGEMSEEGYSDGKTEENIYVDTTVNVNQVGEEDGFGQIDETKNKLIEEYRKEYQMIVNNSAVLIGDEEDFITARLNGLSYIDAYKQCFTYDRNAAINKITENISNNKEWFQTFFDSMSSESFMETIKHFGEVVANMFK